MTDSMGPGKLVCHMQNLSYTYDEYLICIGLGPSISSVICKNLSYSGPSYPSSPVLYIDLFEKNMQLFSNRAPIHNYVERTFSLGKCRGKINTEVTVAHFFNSLLSGNFTAIPSEFMLSMRQNSICQLSNSITFEQSKTWKNVIL